MHAGHVEVRSKQANLLINAIVGLHALEQFERVVKDLGSRMDAQILELANLWLPPSLLGIPLDREHVIGELGTKDELGRIIGQIWLGLGDIDIQISSLLKKNHTSLTKWSL